jgi:hypothetical protein
MERSEDVAGHESEHARARRMPKPLVPVPVATSTRKDQITTTMKPWTRKDGGNLFGEHTLTARNDTHIRLSIEWVLLRNCGDASTV